jgi:hypothetical protein
MVGDVEAREAVRQLVRRLELIAAQGAGMAYVLAKRGRAEYAELLEAAEVATKTIGKPLADADKDNAQVYASLDDPHADWPKAILAMLERGAIVFTGEQAVERMKFVQSLEEHFDAEMKKRSKGDHKEG